LKIERNLSMPPDQNTVVTIGTFDGVHKGHQKIIDRVIESSKSERLKSVVLTFFPHPRMVLQKDSNIKLINTIDERYTILDNLGIDYLFVKTFTKAFSQLDAKSFVEDILVKTLNAKKVIIGYDHRFGKNRTAGIEDLKRFSKIFNFEIEEIPAKDIDRIAISSTKIRHALKAGDINTVNSYLGYHFTLTGKIVKGKGLGKTWGFPTANIHIEEDYKIIPKQGAYIVKTKINNKTVYGMMNIGKNPTVLGNKQTIEAHFLDFNGDIYDDILSVELLEYIRDEKKFENIEALKEQLRRDKQQVLHYIQSYAKQHII